jgi:hypothetical protein
MTSADSLSLILRRLDEIERKLDRMMEELRTTPTDRGVLPPSRWRLADTPGVSLDERDDLLVVERRWLSLAACFGDTVPAGPALGAACLLNS